MNTKLNFSKEDTTFNGTEAEQKLKKELFDDCLLIAQKDYEIDRLNTIIYLIKNNIDITIQIIKEQPTGNDEWLLERLNGIKNIGELKGDSSNE